MSDTQTSTAASSASPRERLHFVNALRVFLIALVVAHHSGQPYGPTGGDWPVSDPVSSDWLLPFFAINAAFFMGFFFLISAYFLPGSYDRKGPVAFWRSRLLRLALPLVLFAVFVNGAFAWQTAGTGKGYLDFLFSDYLGGGRVEYGPLWFIALLLVFSAFYTVWRLVTPPPSPGYAPPAPGHLAVLFYVLALGVTTVLVRQYYPQDRWVRLFGVILFEPAHLPQYASLFVLGIAAGRGAWFTRIRGSVCATWFGVGMAVFLGLFAVVATGISLPGGATARDLWDFCEAFICVGTILGLLALFRAVFTAPSRGIARLAADTYGVYLIHVYAVVALQSALLPVELGALTKFAAVTAAALLCCFPIIELARRVPAVRRVI